jgi:hypothetical protein
MLLPLEVLNGRALWITSSDRIEDINKQNNESLITKYNLIFSLGNKIWVELIINLIGISNKLN